MAAFTMTVNEALLIQRAQLAWYRQAIGRAGVKAIRARTKLPNVNPDVPIPVAKVNEYIPRGGCFEAYVRPRGFRGADGSNALAWHNAIRRGLV